MDVRCTFFVVPENIVNSSFKQEFASCLRTAADFGHELALHGLEHIKNEFGYFYPFPLPFIPIPPFNKQKERIGQATDALIRLTGVRPLGFRAPFYLHNNMTMKVLSDLNFKYDSSKTLFKPTHAARLRVRWPGNCKPHKVQGVLEIPVIGDYVYNQKDLNFRDSLKRTVRDFEWVKSHDGVFVTNIHPNRLSKSLLRGFLQALVNKLKGKTDFVRIVDVNL
jgi:peptidoglycan/xylan/chitin deacetylase (PgdA/CDA1 family)